ncbi:MAG TPA: hypothetical protein VFI61_00275 [Patescibacteria group bacterium]|nr:hypothetical protein [Patescibacteria group bacterium]
MNQNYLKLGGYFILAFTIFFICFILIPRNSLIVKNQNKGQAIQISEVSLTQGGFIIVSLLNPETGFPDDHNILNNPPYLPAGKYKNINIVLNDHALDTANRVSVSLYIDADKNGFFTTDETGNSNLDIRATGLNRKIIRDVINVY